MRSRRETDQNKRNKEERSVGKRKEKGKTRYEAWEREGRKTQKAGINEEAKKRNSFFIHNVSTTY